MKNKLLIGLFVVVFVVLFCVAGSFDTQLLQAGMIH